MGILRDIALGHYRNITDSNKELLDSRLLICKECALYDDSFYGGICATKYLDVDKNTASDDPVDGSVKGCGCVLKAKGRLENSKCPANKW